jgi:hypothetical protein
MVLYKTTAVNEFQSLNPANRVTSSNCILQPVHDGEVPLHDLEIGV